MREALDGVQAGTVGAFKQHRNDRGFLPSGVVYYEYPVGGLNETKLVISHDRRRVYLTVSHYHGYAIRTSTGLVNHNAFVEIVGSVEKPLPGSATPGKTPDVTPTATPGKTPTAILPPRATGKPGATPATSSPQ